jgi:hypothetical protein
MAKVHTDEQTAQDLAAFIEDTAQSIAVARREGRAVPGAPALSTADALAVYSNLLSDPQKAVGVAVRYGKLGTAAIVKELGGAAFLAERPWLEPLLRETWSQLGRGA